jgi:DtxR family Mn-dependent transcriptional regulator
MEVMLALSEQLVTDVVEKYLEAIYRIQEGEGGRARTSSIVKALRVVPGTVTSTVERLEKDGLVQHAPYKGVRLTKKGRFIALQVIRRHRLCERLLTDILRVDIGKSHELARRIEHAIDDEDIIRNLEKALDHPRTCPHGRPIPTKCGAIIEKEETARP